MSETNDVTEFPSLWSERDVPLPAPFDGVLITVKSVRPRTYRKWIRAWARYQAAERHRVAVERETQKDNPAAVCHKDGYATDEGEDEAYDILERVLKGCLAGVKNAVCGDLVSDSISEQDAMIDFLDHTVLLAAAGVVAMSAQVPKAQEKKV